MCRECDITMQGEMVRKNPEAIEEGMWSEDIRNFGEKSLASAQWYVIGSSIYKPAPLGQEKLPAGAYDVSVDKNDDMPLLLRKALKSDEFIRFKNSLPDTILNEMEEFWGKMPEFHKAGFLHRRGYLLYGKHGAGKSMVVQHIVREVVANDGVVLFCGNPIFFNKGIRELRKVEPHRRIICVFEDIDAIIDKYADSDILALLDGENTVDGVLNIATTNYPEKLDKRIISRPRRFDRIIKIEPPEEAVRREYLQLKLPKGQKVSEWVKVTADLSFASLAEAVISVVCLGNSLPDTILRLKEIEEGSPASDEFGTEVGFNRDDEDDT